MKPIFPIQKGSVNGVPNLSIPNGSFCLLWFLIPRPLAAGSFILLTFLGTGYAESLHITFSYHIVSQSKCICYKFRCLNLHVSPYVSVRIMGHQNLRYHQSPLVVLPAGRDVLFSSEKKKGLSLKD